MTPRRSRKSPAMTWLIRLGLFSMFAMLIFGAFLVLQVMPWQAGPKAGLPEGAKALPEIKVPQNLFGWDQAESRGQLSNQIRAGLPRFEIKGAPPQRGQKACLWWFSQQVLGKHVETLNQQIGDCVSMGATNAADYLQVTQIALGFAQEYHHIFPPYVYGTSRVQIGGGRISGDGSVGSWAAEAMKQYGVLRADHPQCPKYSGSVARDWGRNGPPKWALEEGKLYPIKTYSKVTSYLDVYNSICNGYPVTIASNVGFEGGSYQKDGKVYLRKGGSWGHQMSIIAVDDTGTVPSAYIMNSWGTTWVVSPIGDEPPGGFWVVAADVESIVRQDDSFAFSSFEGFPSTQIDWNSVQILYEMEGYYAKDKLPFAPVYAFGGVFGGPVLGNSSVYAGQPFSILCLSASDNPTNFLRFGSTQDGGEAGAGRIPGQRQLRGSLPKSGDRRKVSDCVFGLSI